MKKLRLSKNGVLADTLSLYVAHAANYLIPLLLIPYLSRRLTPSGWGEVVLSLAMAQYVTLYVEYAFHLSGQREVSRVRDNRQEVEAVLSRVTSAKLLLTFIALPFLALLIICIPSVSTKLIFLAVCYALTQAFVFSWFLRGISKTSLSAAIDLSTKAGSAVVAIVLVRAPQDSWIYVLSLSVGGLLNIAISIKIIKASYSFHIDFKKGLAEIKKAFAVFKLHAIGTILSLTPVLLLGLFANTASVGIYSAADKLARTIAALMDPVRHVMYPRMSYSIASNRTRMNRDFRVTLVVMTGMGALLSISTFLLAPVLVTIVFGEAFLEATRVLEVLSMLPVLIAVGNVFVVLWLLPHRDEDLLFRIILTSLIVLLCAGFAAMYLESVTGMATAVVCAETFVVVVSGYFSYMRYKRNMMTTWGGGLRLP